MASDETLQERLLSAGYEVRYESEDWTVLTRGGRFFAIETRIDASARLAGAYSELVAGSYEHTGTLVADLIRMKEDYEKMADQVGRENSILIFAALLLILGNAYYDSKTSGIQASDLKYLLLSSLIILGVASLFSMIRGVEIKRVVMGAWPERIRNYQLRGAAFKQLYVELGDEKGSAS